MAKKAGRPPAQHPRDVKYTAYFTAEESRIIDACARGKYAAFIRQCVLTSHAYTAQAGIAHAAQVSRSMEPRQVTIAMTQTARQPEMRTVTLLTPQEKSATPTDATIRSARRAEKHADLALETRLLADLNAAGADQPEP